MKMLPEIHIIDINSAEHLKGEGSILTINDLGKKKPTSMLWGPLDESFITGHENGSLTKWEVRMPKNILNEVVKHKGQINDLQYNKNQTMFISASKDTTAKVRNF